MSPELSRLRTLARRALPDPALRGWHRLKHSLRRWPPPGLVRFGSLRRLTPISSVWGFDRGLPVDRYYIERFLRANSADIHGVVMEVADHGYTRRYGSGVTRSEVVDVDPDNPQATIVADLRSAEHLAEGTFDCIILTQTLHLIDDVEATLDTVHRILRPGGVLLATFPGISQISHHDAERSGDFWRFTTSSAERLFEAVAPRDRLTVQSHGNVLAATAFLYGLSAGDLRRRELEHVDPRYQLLISVRAVKSDESGRA